MYEQLKKNTVKADNQIKVGNHIVITNSNGKGSRVMFLGNSITLHAYKPEIGWHGQWGMAASCEEKDYVHLMMDKINEVNDDPAFCVCQTSYMELHYKEDYDLQSRYEAAADFGADIIVLRIIENCKADVFDGEKFIFAMEDLFKYLDKSGKAKFIITSSFWNHPGDKYLAEFAEKNNYPFVKINDLGEDDSMKAIGLFEHKGVANHPGDLGMKMIAERIFDAMKDYLD